LIQGAARPKHGASADKKNYIQHTIALPIDAPRLHFEHIAFPCRHAIPLLGSKTHLQQEIFK
jgi:hypothetical protein